MNKTELNSKLKKLYNSTNSKTISITNKTNHELIKLYKDSLSDIRNEVSKLYEKLGDDISFAKANQMNRLINLENNISGILKELKDDSYSVIKDSLTTVYDINYKALPEGLQNMFDTDIAFGKVNEDLVKKSIENPLQYLDKNSINTNNQIREELTKGLIKGDSYSKTAKAITERVNVSASNANLITRTESHRTQSEARADAFSDVQDSAGNLGLNLVKVWIASDGGNHRHGFMNGVQSDESGMFDFDGMSVEEPGMTGDPGEDCNCMCTTGVEVI